MPAQCPAVLSRLCPLALAGALVLPLAWPGSLFSAHGQRFDPALVYSTGVGSYPYAVAVGDVNGDGLADLVTANNNTGTGVLLGQPGGGFAPVSVYPSGTGCNTGPASGCAPVDVALGDVNGDGRLDIVVANYLSNSAGVLLGRAGGFGIATNYPVGGSGTQRLVLADVNGDGRLDIITTQSSSDTIGVLLGQAGGFGAPVLHSTGILNALPYGLAVGDVTGDGQLDIVSANAGGTIGVLPGQANGFGAIISYPTGLTSYYALALLDVNGDNLLDAVGTSATNAGVGILLQQPGGFGPITTLAAALPANTAATALADVTGDGLPDIITTDGGVRNIGVLSGLAGGGFGPAVSFASGGSVSGAGLYQYVTVADANDDGWPDIVAVNAHSHTLGVLLAAVPSPPVPVLLSPGAGLPGSAIALDGTGLTGATAVIFCGPGTPVVRSGFVVNAAGTRISGVVVPPGAASGRVRIVTPGGTLTSTSRFVVQALLAAHPGRTVSSVFSLVPNPAHSAATLTLPAAPAARPVLLHDALGRAVRRATLPAQATELALDLSGLAPGLYAVRCGAATARLVVE